MSPCPLDRADRTDEKAFHIGGLGLAEPVAQLVACVPQDHRARASAQLADAGLSPSRGFGQAADIAGRQPLRDPAGPVRRAVMRVDG